MGYGIGISILKIRLSLYESVEILRQPHILSATAKETFSRGTSHAVGRGHERHGR